MVGYAKFAYKWLVIAFPTIMTAIGAVVSDINEEFPLARTNNYNKSYTGLISFTK